MEGVDLEVLQQDAAVAVHDRLREPGRSGAEEHVQRVVEGDSLESEVSGLGGELAPGDGIGDRRAIGQVGHHHRRLQAGQGSADGRQLLCPIHVSAPVPVPVDGHQHRWLDLPETVDHASRAELRCAGRPDCPDAGRREQPDGGLRHIGQVGGHSVARPNAQAPQASADPGHRVSQLPDRELLLGARVRVRDHHDIVLVAVRQPECVRGPVQPSAREPTGTRHV